MSIQPLWLTYFIEILLVLEFQLTKTYFGTFSYKAHFRPQISSNGTSRCEESFQQLKNLLTSAPVLKVADPEKDFVVCTDACGQGLGGVLMQDNHVICYESRKLKEHEKNYATHDLELAAIVHALKMWKHYLMGRIFELKTDHYGLNYLFDHPTLNARQGRWLEFLYEFDFEIKHIKGKENKVANVLNRKVQEMQVASLSIFQSDLRQQIVNHAAKDELYVQVKDKLQQKSLKISMRDI